MAKSTETLQRKTIRFPLIADSFHRPSGTTVRTDVSVDQHFINCVFDKITNPHTQHNSFAAFKRKGLGTPALPTGCTEFLGAETCRDEVISLWRTSAGNDLAIAIDGVVMETIVCTNATAASRIAHMPVSGTQHGLAFWVLDNGVVRAFIYNMDADTTTEITDVDFPDSTIIGNFVYKNGFLYIMTSTTGGVYNSDLNALSTYDPTNFTPVQHISGGCGLAGYKDKIVAFGQEFIEFFEDVGNLDGSPLRRMDELAIRGFGIQKKMTTDVNSSHFILEALDTVFWLNNDLSKAGFGVYMLDNFKPVKVSSSQLDRILAKQPGCHLSGIVKMHGHNYLIIHDGVGTSVFALNLDLQLWSRWTWGTTMSSLLLTTQSIDSTKTQVLFFSDAGAHKMDESVDTYTDNGSAFTDTIQTRIVDLDTEKRKRLHKLSLIGLDSRAASTTSISWSDDDYQTFTTARTVDLNNQRTYLTNLGAFRRRAFKITNAANTPVYLTDLELEYSELRN
jgi:hypothetical protein